LTPGLKYEVSPSVDTFVQSVDNNVVTTRPTGLQTGRFREPRRLS